MKILSAVCVLTTIALMGCAEKRVATDFAGMRQHAPAGSVIFVTTTDGERVKGRVGTISSAFLELSLRDGGTRGFVPADVSEIRVRDPLWNGLLTGAGVGGLMGALSDESCSAPSASPGCRKVSRGAGIAIGTAAGAGIGAGIDALLHRRVFLGARPQSSSRPVVEVFVSPAAASLRWSLGW